MNALIEAGNVKAGYYGPNIFEKIINHKNVTPENLDKLADKGEDDIRQEVANNSRTSKETLDKLADDENKDVRMAVAANKNTSIEILDKLVYVMLLQ